MRDRSPDPAGDRAGGAADLGWIDAPDITIAIDLQASPRFHRLVRHLHRLGPRPRGELLMEIGREHGIEVAILERLEAYGQLAPDVVAQLGDRDWPPVPLVVVQAQCRAEGRAL